MAAGCLLLSSPVLAQVVPGTGYQVTQVGDDFEDEDWSYEYNFPKSSSEQDEQVRAPVGRSTNGRWFESTKRGQPDEMRRVATPPDGLPGSNGSLLIRTLRSGVPGTLSHQMQQDDLLLNISQRMGGTIPVSRTPNFVVRVWLPPFDQWEDRSGPTFAVRAGLRTTKYETSKGLFGGRREPKTEPYWPGMFIQFESETDRQYERDGAFFTVRATRNGSDFRGPRIEQTGWWTLGMSITPDGQLHYYASPGVDDLTPEDYIASQFPYGFRAETFNTFFFNICNRDDGRTWSTSWIIDDPQLYVLQR
ncbi:MAG: hypothetical protein J5I93_00965 [Pirellulaceae bacterium]|nr:hypothetical protein [Pirellulaceae bacterium]